MFSGLKYSRSWAQRAGAILLVGGSAAGLAGCQSTLQGKPARLYTAAEQMAGIRATVESLSREYDGTKDPDTRKQLRNDIVASILLAYNTNYTEFEASLTRDRQLLGFGAGTTAVGLNAVGTIAGGATSPIMNALAGAVTNVKGQYDSEIVIAKTVQIVEAQMQANRDTIAARIIKKMALPVVEWPLPLALSELEDYYRAGTFTSGLIKAGETVGEKASVAADAKADAAIRYDFSPDANSQLIRAYLKLGTPGDADRITKVRNVTSASYAADLYALLNDPEAAAERVKVVKALREQKLVP